MKIPSFAKYKFVDQDGELTSPFQQMFDVFFQQAQDNLSDDGLVVPQRETADINYIASAGNVNSRPDGTLWYDSDTDELKVKIAGAVKVIQTI